MTVQMALVFGLILLALVLFAYERMRIDATAVLVMTLLMLSGILTPADALSGFSNIATVTVAAMFVLSAGLRQTGALVAVGDGLGRLGKRNSWLALGVMMLTVGVVSAFINNTAAVAIFIPVVVGMARDMRESPSRLLMPLSFASMFGGVSTLIGTSTNLLVNAIAIDAGLEPLGMFEFTALGLILFAVGFLYLLVAVRFIPRRRAGIGQDLTARFEVAPYIAVVRVDDRAPFVGETVADNLLTRHLDVEVIDVHRDGQALSGVGGQIHLQAGDVLHVRADAPEIHRLLDVEGVGLVPSASPSLDAEIESERDTLIEVVVAPDSQLGGQTIEEVNFPGRHGAQVLAVRQHGRLRHDLRRTVLRGGNSLLLKINRERLGELRQLEDFVIVSEVVVPRIRRDRMVPALTIIVAVVALAAFDVLPIVVAAVAGGLAMVGIGALTAEEAYEAINWKVIFLLAGVLPLGEAMEKTGAARLLADLLITNLDVLGPLAVLSAFFLLTQLLTSIISNNAAAVLFAPIALSAAARLGVDGRPFVFAVAVAASMSFLTPIGYQTNTLIYGPGHFRFGDFVRIGLPLTLLVWVVASFAIPLIWPL